MNTAGQTIIIGVDGGGTGCRAAIGTPPEGILEETKGGRGNVASDPENAVTNVLDAINTAAAKAGISKELLASATVHLGLAGVMKSEDSARISSALPYKDVTVTDDRPTALNGALGGKDGFLLSVGTGTITAAKSGDSFRSVGGWGFHVADQASGAWLGRAGLQQVLLCHDGLEHHTALTRALFAEFGNDPNAIVAFSLSAKPGDYAAFAPIIVAGASGQDPWGEVIMQHGANHLKKCLSALDFQHGDTICLTGGVGPHYAPYLPRELLAGQIECKGSALKGAFHLALERHAQRLKVPS